MRVLILLATVIGLALPVEAQVSPYAGQESRKIKALSPSEIEGYLNGEGMGFAKAAELNHYPGPRHALDLRKELGLTREQIERTEALFRKMKEHAMQLGRALVEKERELDGLFAEQQVTPGQLESLLAEIAKIRGRLRYEHLRAHLEQKNILSSHQIMLYDKLRGYGSDHTHFGQHHPSD